MKARKRISILLAALVTLALAVSPALAQGDGDVERPAGWDEYSHGNSTDPDYAVVFPDDAVNTITISISPENWQAMLDDMTGLYGEFGSREGSGGMGGGPGGMGGQFQPGGQRPEGGEPPADMGQQPQGGMGGFPGGGVLGGNVIENTENPIWVPADITFGDQVWTNVGIRFKGNSSLMSSWGGGSLKLPFRLDFDEFEDTYPEIDNQRFYGFKELTFSSGWSDDSLLRERVTADIFREAGVPAPETAFYAVYVDYGEGPIYFGLYTAVEVVDDTVIQTQFADDGGNVYKPEGPAATFVAGTFDEDQFDKETNQDENDFSDVLALFDALHAETRTTDPTAWRSSLEAIFDVDTFMRWLAVNTVIQNWDTYGQMAHNYYLYADPSTGLITWIPWDNNMAMMEGMGGGMGGRDGGGRGGPGSSVTLDLESVSADWPLIRYLMDDPVYHGLYVTYVEETINGAFEPARMEAIFTQLHDLIAPYVVGENGEAEGYTNLSSAEAFESALADLIEHVNQRYTEASDYLSSQAAAQ